MEAAGTGGKGGERGAPEAAGSRADPFNPAESDRLGALVVADILEVLQEAGEKARRMVPASGPEAACSARCAGSCHEVNPPGSAEEGGRQR